MTGTGSTTSNGCREYAGRPGRLERRVTLAQVLVFLPHGEEAAVVRVLPVAASAFALLDDLVDGGLGGGGIGDRDHLWPAEPLRRRLGAGRADEQGAFAEPIGECHQPALDAAVEVADRRELLPVRHCL